jgi:hypothetical protein
LNRVTIAPANLRDMTYIGANLRPDDAREILCQVPAGTTGAQAAAAIFQSVPGGWAWTASLDGNPACAFGFQPFTSPVWIGWAFGTRRMIRTIPAITRHCLLQEPRLLDLGVKRVEVRTLADHDISHQWLTRLGCRFAADLPDHGRNRELFQLWAWSLTHGLPSLTKDYRNVCSEDAESTQASDPAEPQHG